MEKKESENVDVKELITLVQYADLFLKEPSL